MGRHSPSPPPRDEPDDAFKGNPSALAQCTQCAECWSATAREKVALRSLVDVRVPRQVPTRPES
jgi:hypothetical protein